jgi:hypothetical protein
VVWGDEDVEFYRRLEPVGCEVKEWHRTPESRQAVVANLEWPEMSDEEALSWSQRYFGHESSGPRFVPYRTGYGSFERYDKSSDFLGPATTRCGAGCACCLLTTRARTSLRTS